MTRRQGHLLQCGGVPRAYDQTAVCGVRFDGFDDGLQLVVAFAGVVCMYVNVLCAKVPPLESVDRPQIALLSVRESDAVQVFARAVAVPDMNLCLPSS